MICPKCGGNIKDDARFCSFCGENVVNFNAAEQKQEIIVDKIVDKCPSCGATIAFDENTTAAYCEYCSSKIRVKYQKKFDPSLYKNVDSYIVPLTINKSEAESACLSFMAKRTDIDVNVFEQGQVMQVTPILMPFYKTYYEGNVSYTASIGYDRQETYTEYKREAKTRKRYDGKYETYYETVPVTKTRTVTDWTPFNNSERGVGTYVYICASDFMEDFLPTIESRFIDGEECSGNILFEAFISSSNFANAIDFDEFNVSNIKLIPPNLDIDSGKKVYHAYEVFYNYMYFNCKGMLPSGYNTHSKDLKISLSDVYASLRHTVYVPFWIIQYSYNNNYYTMLVNGSDGSVINDKLPKSELVSNKLEELNKTADKKVINSIAACIVIGAVFGGIFMGTGLGDFMGFIFGMILGGLLGLVVGVFVGALVRKKWTTKVEVFKTQTKATLSAAASQATLFRNRSNVRFDNNPLWR